MSVSSRITRRVLGDQVVTDDEVVIATDLMIADQSFMFDDENGLPLIISEGDLVRAGHPLLGGREQSSRRWSWCSPTTTRTAL